MRDPGRISAAIEILADFETRRVPLKVCLSDWARTHRFAGAKDRAWISGLCLDALRRRAELLSHMTALGCAEGARSQVLAALKFCWSWEAEQIRNAAAEEPHGPGALSPEETEALMAAAYAGKNDLCITGNFPDWLEASAARVFDDPAGEMAAFALRAPVDLRANSLKADTEKALKSVSVLGASESALFRTALRIPPPEASERAGSVETIPAYGKGWVEVQDLGSQIAAAAAGVVAGAQVLDFCAGAGGKTLALAALAGNRGQIFAWDIDGRRLTPMFERMRRAGARNIQVRSPADGGTLSGLEGKMDCVFVDAPCTGSGTWRRRPDTKWRLTRKQLDVRIKEQDQVLAEASRYVKPGGRMVYVTCSFLAEENEDRLVRFKEENGSFRFADTLGAMKQSGLLTAEGEAALADCVTADGALRLTPARCGTDGFFVSVLEKA